MYVKEPTPQVPNISDSYLRYLVHIPHSHVPPSGFPAQTSLMSILHRFLAKFALKMLLGGRLLQLELIERDWS